MSPELFREFSESATLDHRRKLTLQEIIAWQVKHDAKRQAEAQYERDRQDEKHRVSP